jgi:hypothetical protein
VPAGGVHAAQDVPSSAEPPGDVAPLFGVLHPTLLAGAQRGHHPAGLHRHLLADAVQVAAQEIHHAFDEIAELPGGGHREGKDGEAAL